MRKTKRNIIGIIMALLFIFNFVGCKSAEEKAMEENRTFIDTKYTEADFVHGLFSTGTDAKKFVEGNKDKFVRWSAHITSIQGKDEIYMREGELPELQAKFSYNINKDNKYKEGDLITFSGNIDTYVIGMFGTTPNYKLKNCRIEQTTKDDKKTIEDYLASAEDAKKAEVQKAEQEKEENDKQQKEALEEAQRIISADYISFEEPYSKMTEIQKDDYFKTVKGRYVQWTGEVIDVDKHTIGVRCLNSTLTEDFVAIVDNLEPDKLKSIQKGSQITIKGKISQQEGNALPWTLNNCTIV